jgi:hypothetical protein
MCVGNRRENVGRRVREENDDVREHGGERADVRSRDMGMEGTGGGGEGAREIFEMGARSGQRNTRVHSEGRVQEEQAESKSGKESGKVRGQNGRKGRMQREKYCRRNGYASEEVERMREEGRWMCAELSERDRDTDKQERRERIREARYNREYERCVTEDVPVYLGRERARKKGK